MNDLLTSAPKAPGRTISNRQRLERTLKELLAGRQTIRKIRQDQSGRCLQRMHS